MGLRCTVFVLYCACIAVNTGCAPESDNFPDATERPKTIKELGQAIAAALKGDLIFPTEQEELQAESWTVDITGEAQSPDALHAIARACGWKIAVEDDGKRIAMSLHPRATKRDRDSVHVCRVRDDKVAEIALIMGSRRAVQKTYGVGRTGSLLAVSCKSGDLDYVRKVVELLQLDAPPERHCFAYRMTEERAAEVLPNLEETLHQERPQDESYESQIFWFPEAQMIIIDVSNTQLFDKLERVIQKNLFPDN